MKKKLLFFAISIFISSKMNSQIIPVSLDYKVTNSPFIVEGEIIEAVSFQDEFRRTIFTNYKLKVISVVKGSISEGFITIRNLGGTVGENTLKVCPNSSFEIGDKGIYFISKISNILYEPSFLGQSEYPGYKLEKNNKNKFELKTVFLESKATLGIITSISPTIVDAGVGDVVTITGTGFGATPPPSGQKVWVPRANSPGSYVSQSDFFNYVSWSDTEIKYKVSSDAASGKIRVGYATTYAESTQNLQVNYNVKDQFNGILTNIYPIVLPAINNGGIEFIKNTNFTNPDAINAILIAMDNWTCNTGIKLNINATVTTGNTNVTNDGQNVLFFANLGATVLGLTYSNITACSTTGRSYVSDVDLGINSSQPFNYTLNPTIAGQYDYYNVVLHELGHVRNLGHVGDTNDIMYPSLSAGVANRSLNANNIAGGLWVQNESQTVTICSKPLMIAGVCQNLSNTELIDEVYQIQIVPNPNNGKFFIKGINFFNQNAEINIFNIQGKLLLTKKITSVTEEIQTEALVQGIYILNIKLEDGSSSIHKIVIN